MDAQFALVSLRMLDYHRATGLPLLHDARTRFIALRIAVDDLIGELELTIPETNDDLPWALWLAVFVDEPFKGPLSPIHPHRWRLFHFSGVFRAQFWGRANDTHVIAVTYRIFLYWVIY